jgi:superfamily II DNA or RNA helicase
MLEFQINIDLDEEGNGVLESTHFEIIRNKFSWANPEYRFAPKWRKNQLMKKCYAIDTNGKFPIGLLNEIYDFTKAFIPHLNKNQFIVSSRARYFYEPSFLLPTKYELHQFDGWEYRDIQLKALDRVFVRGRGIVKVGTSGGKGLIMASICRTILNYNPCQTIAILVPTHLVGKTYDEFIDEFKFTTEQVSQWTAKGKEDFTTPIIIVGSNLSVARAEKFHQHIGNRNLFLIDECHIIKDSSKITQLVKSVKTNNIIGFTGTLPPEPQDLYSVLGNIGKVVCNVESSELRDKGLKARSKVYSTCFTGCSYKPVKEYVDEEGSEKIYTDTQMFTNEMEYLLRSPERTDYICRWVLKVCTGNTMIPVDRDFHEEILKERLENCGRKVIVINGDTPEEERTKAYSDMENEEGTILIVKTGVMREGISIKNLSFMVGFFAQKSFIRIIQLLGRIERLGGNEVPIFFDFYDTTYFSKKHYTERKSFYKKDKTPVVEKRVKLNY